MHFTQFDSAEFLRTAWQKQPRLIRNPWPAWHNPLEPDELAGLACEPDVEARLVTYARDNWDLEHGPLREDRFAKLGKKEPWTLLVQAVDHHVPAVAALLDPFRFIPNWRIDDVVVSYAVDGGGVGPHFDQYDVFLVQGLGKRRWQLGGLCDGTTELQPNDHLRLLARFEPFQEWILEPGDILYVPPRVAHCGVAIGDDCMTYSVGFRAPSRAELLAGWTEHLLEELEDGDRFADPDLQHLENPGEISAPALERLHGMVAERLLDRAAFARWFGTYSSTPKNPDIDWRPEQPIAPDDLREVLGGGSALLRNPASRFSFVREGPGSVALFVDGRSISCTGAAAAFAELLCGNVRFTVDPVLLESAHAMLLIAELVDAGSLAFSDED